MEIDSGWIKQQIDLVREQIGRTITVYYSKKEPCSICVASGWYDPVSDSSWYTICPECQGDYYRNTSYNVEILARVHWVSNEAYTASPGGRHFLGTAQITVDPSYRTDLVLGQADAGGVLVDDQDFSIHKIIPMGAPTINRVRAILIGKGERPE